MGSNCSPSKITTAKLLPAIFLLTACLLSQGLAAIIINKADSPQFTVDIPFVKSQNSSAVEINCTTGQSSIDFTANVRTLSLIQTENGAIWRTENEGIAGVDGMPDLPVVSRWVRVPPAGDLKLDFTIGNQVRRNGDSPARFRNLEEGSESFVNPELVEMTDIWPEQPVTMSRPMIWRGIRMVNLVLYPVQWNASTGEYILNENFSTEILATQDAGENQVEALDREPCRDFDRAVDGLLVNPPPRDESYESYPPGSYLVVANDNYPDVVDEFITWKRISGHRVEVLTFDPSLVFEVELKEQIRRIYQQSPFSYLVFIGNEEVNPPLLIPYDDEFYDNYFAQLEGNDPIADVAVGTYNCRDIENLICAIRRTISYERTPDIQDPAWFTKGFVGVGACSVPDDLSPSYSGKWVQAVLERNGYEVASSYFSDNGENDPSPAVAEQYSAGVNLVIVRGHQNNFDPDEIQERGVYPFHFMVSSSTISPGNWGSFNRTFRMGTSDDMRGPSAGFGHYPSPRTNIANAIVGGLTEALFLKDIRSFGWARQYLTAKIPIVMPAEQGQILTRYWGTLRYYGDPGQEPWEGVPQEVRVIAPNSFALDQSAFSVRVLTRPGFRPVSGAAITVYQEGTLQKTVRSNDNGYADVLWTPGILSEDPVYITVTGRGILPVTDTLEHREQEGMMAASRNIELVEGNTIVPAERAAIRLTLVNTGTEDIQRRRTIVSLFSEDEGLDFEGHYDQALSLPVGDSIVLDDVFSVTASPRAVGSAVVEAHANTIVEMGTSTWTQFELTIEGADMKLDSLAGEERAAPDREIPLSMAVSNIGQRTATGINVSLVSLSPYVLVTSGESSIPDIEPGEWAEQVDPFVVQFLPTTIDGTTANLMAIISGEPGLADTIRLDFPISRKDASDPTGPDRYGYIALENGDGNTVWANAPEYDWIDISPWGGELQGRALDFPASGEVDSSLVIDLPFTFRYYDVDYRQITICNNGWIAMGNQTELKNQQNWPMPGYNGASGMIAPFWDRLEMVTRSDGVFVYFDEDNHRFIVQWQTGTIDNRGDWYPNAFQVILYDPRENETVSGDSPFLFQYETVNDVQGHNNEANYFCTAGISSPDERDGTTITYWRMPTSGSRILAGERAILWTTTAWEPRGSVDGHVTRYIDSTVVAGAQVESSNNRRRIIDEEGYYRMVVPAGNDLTISASAPGYGEAVSDEIDLAEGDHLTKDFVLPHGWVEVPQDTIVLISEVFRDENWARGDLSILNRGNLSAAVFLELIVPDRNQWSDSLVFQPLEEHDTLDVEPGRFGVGLLVGGNVTGEFRATLRIHSDTPTGSTDRPLVVYLSSDVEGGTNFPLEYSLAMPFPNPFNSRTRIDYSLAKSGDVRIVLADIMGREVQLLADARKEAGRHSLTLDAGDLPTGVYLLRMESGEFRATQRVLLLR